MKSILIRVVDGSGNGLADKDVTIWESGFFGNRHRKGRTDRSGAVELLIDASDSAYVDINVDGREMVKNQCIQANYRFVL